MGNHAGERMDAATTSATMRQLGAALADRYRIERELGAGGMATVYLAHDLKHDRDVAIKVMHPEIAQTLGAERFLREIQLAAKLSHPHILALFDSGEADGALYYVMPRVEGQSVRDRLEAGGPLPVEEAVRIASEVAGALDYAHRHDVVHRDIKPGNILLHDGHALVADFGIAKALSSVESEGATQAGTSVGTPAYMSPEQAAGDALDARTDLYSLGCVLYEMLVGAPPFTGATVQAVIAKRFVQTPANVTALRPGVPRPVARAVQRALERLATDRFESGSEFAAALAAPDTAQASAAPQKSIAVLPFANLSADAENEFFADGITEEILNALTQVAELRVAGRMSSFSFKGKNENLRRIGEQLNVRTVLEGSVRRAGNQVRITAQLIDATDGFHLWSERYDRDIGDVFAVQDEIATAIALEMQATLHVGAATRAQRATDSIEAYEAYLKGRALLYRRGPAIREGLALMDTALSLDPAYGLAWAGVADTYSLLGGYSLIPPELARAKAGEACANALRFGPDLAESHASRAAFAIFYEWDWAGAERSFRRALELNPGYLQGAVWYWYFYEGMLCRRWDAAIAGLLECHARDPLSGYTTAMVAIACAVNFRHPAALEWADRAVALEPDAFFGLHARQLALISMEDWPGAVAAAQTALASPGRAPMSLMLMGMSLSESGNAPAAHAVHDQLRSLGTREYVSPLLLAVLEAALGERVAAVAHVREAAARKDPSIALFSSMRGGIGHVHALPEMQQLLADIGLTSLVERAHA